MKSPPSDALDTKLLLVDPSEERTVAQHPDVMPFLEKGWDIRRTEPRIVESDGTTQVLVVLERLSSESRSPSDNAEPRNGPVR